MFKQSVFALCAMLLGAFPALASEANVRKAFEARFPSMKIESITRMPFPGLYEVVFDGQVVYEAHKRNLLKPRRMLDRGLYYLPSDRRQEGLVMMQNVRENVALSSLWLSTFSNALFLRRGSERGFVKDLARRLDLAPLNIERDLEHFSGGNQQKVLVGKSLARDVKLFIFDEPTVGVDVGARVHIYNFIRELCEAGAGVLLISSDLPEILHLPNRAYVMYRGELRAELPREEISEQAVLSHFFEKQAA